MAYLDVKLLCMGHSKKSLDRCEENSGGASAAAGRTSCQSGISHLPAQLHHLVNGVHLYCSVLDECTLFSSK
jgi:hypothetical protein